MFNERISYLPWWMHGYSEVRATCAATSSLYIIAVQYQTYCQPDLRLQLYSILKYDWWGTWLLLPIDATYRGFYWATLCRHCGGPDWAKLRGGAIWLLTRTRVTYPLSVSAHRGWVVSELESSKSPWFLLLKRSSDSILNRMLLKTEALA